MNIAGLLLLIVAHYLSGKGVIRLFKLELSPVAELCLSLMVGVPLISFVPCLLQLARMPIAVVPMVGGICTFTGICSIPLMRNFRRPTMAGFKAPVYYEWPFLGVCAAFMLFSAWRCFYYPPYARDMLAGPELLAEYAVKEKNMVSSVFTIDLQNNNNYFKSPYITSLQILYKLLVQPFGQLWMSLLALPFMAWLYTLLRQRIHPLLAGCLLFLFTTIPELYSYSYVMLYDYSNMVFFFAGFYFLNLFLTEDRTQTLLFSALLFGLATYIRAETLIILCLFVPALVLHFGRRKTGVYKAGLHIAVFGIVPLLFYVLCVHVFVRFFVPIPFDVSGQMAQNLSNFSVLYSRARGIFSDLIFSVHGMGLYGYYIYLFCLVVITDVFFFRKFNHESRLSLYGILVVFAGLVLIGYVLPLADLENTTKRGLFKLLPIMLLYLCNSSALRYVSSSISGWEHANLR